MSEIEKLQGLGPTSAAWLAAIGVHTRADLEEIGVAAAYCLIGQSGVPANKNLLWALQGALDNCHWIDISESKKAELLKEVERIKNQ